MLTLTHDIITLSTLVQTEIEQVRVWRNMPEISSKMEYNQYITQQQQEQWFDQLQHKNNCYYFIITVNHKKIGLAHLSDVNLTNKSAQVGLFIGENNFIGTGVALAASALLLQFAFDNLNLAILYAKVKNGNTTAINYNDFLGFRFDCAINDGFNQYKITYQDYKTLQKKIHDLANVALHV